MLRNAAVSRILQGLGFRDDLSAEVILALQEEQRDLEQGKSLPRFLLLEDQTLPLVAGNQDVSLPSNFLRRYTTKLRYVPVGSSKNTYISWRGFDNAETAYVSYDPAGPQTAVLRKSTIRFYPVPDTNYTVYWDYYKSDSVLTSDIENLWLANAPELLIGGAGLRVAMDIRNKEAVELFTGMRGEAKVSLFKDIVLEDGEEQDFLQLGGNA